MRSGKRIIAISGMPGAGKGVASAAAKQLGFDVLVLGDVVREETERRGLDPTPQNVGAVMLKIREIEGPTAVAKRLIPKVEQCQSNIVIVEGIRSLHEVAELKCKFEVVTLAIHASPQTRFQRLLSRGRSDDPKSWDTFYERDTRELTVGLGSVIALADRMATNESTITELQSSVKNILAELRTRWT
jgi:dephospho-CoA kinase